MTKGFAGVARVSAGVLQSGVAVSALLIGSTAWAQDAAEPSAPSASATTASSAQPIEPTAGDVTAGAGGPAIGSGESAIPFPDSNGNSADTEIVVTGTLLRGKAPTGSNFISLGQQRIAEIGAVSSNELLASLPQVTNYFNNVPLADLSFAVNQFQISRPNIRNIGVNNAAESPTLVITDGHRIATAGVNQSSVDPDIFPTGAIERVEVVTEGGSATYGTDAVAGTINFITRKRFNGLSTNFNYGFADDYYQTSASVTAGRDWGSGSAYVSYTFTKNDALFGRDRGFIKSRDYASAPPYPALGINCDPPTVQIGATQFNDRCDYGNGSVVPRATRHGVLASLFQNLDDKTSVDLKVYYSQRKTLSSDSQNGSVIVRRTNPYFSLPAGAPAAAASETVNFTFDSLNGRGSAHSTTLLKEWGANAEFKRDLGENWQLRTLFNYSGSDTSFELPQANVTRLNAAGSSSDPNTAINPFDLSQTNPAVIASILDNEIAGQARDNLFNIRPILEGKLFSLPGGDVRLAVGYEYIRDEFQQRYKTDIGIGTLGDYRFNKYDRTVNSVFGEISIPIVGEENAMPGLRSLVISGSGRYDHYSDFGSTTNPKVGASYKPVDWLTIRGNWGTSFTAPSPLDQLGSNNNTVSAFPFIVFRRAGDPTNFTGYTVAVQGSLPNLKPQTATTWSLGFDASPPIIPGLKVGLSYWNVKFKDILSTPIVDADILANFPNQITTADFANVSANPPTGLSAAQVRAFESQAPNGATVLEPLIANGSLIYQLVDFRVSNFGILKVDGFDFNVSYQHKFDFGQIDANVNGNYVLNRTSQASPTSPTQDVLARNNSRLQLQSALGTTIENIRAQVTWNHNAGFKVTPTGTPPQTKVGAFDTVDLFFKYDMPGDSGVFKNLSLTLNVNNVANAHPPEYHSNTPGIRGYTNGFTLGRLVQFGIAKKF